jgi:hypothetical protein
MSGELGARGFYDYVSDNGTTYCVRMRTALATAGGFSASSASKVNYPRGWEMRHVYGKKSDGTRKKLPVAAITETTWSDTPGTFAVGSLSGFTVMGQIGEKRCSG